MRSLAFLSILQRYSLLVLDVWAIEVVLCRNGFPAAVRLLLPPNSCPHVLAQKHGGFFTSLSPYLGRSGWMNRYEAEAV
jgi:hypothetical protein